MNFRSGLEKNISDFLSSTGLEYEYESKKVPYVLTCNCIPDFILKNGVMLEAKGHLSPDDRRKMLARTGRTLLANLWSEARGSTKVLLF